MNPPTISVLMPAFNSERYVSEATESILAQTFRDFEFIIINDGSTDGTLKILETFAARDSRIRLISRPNTGYTNALNEGLALARGKYIARMDSDDISLPDRFERQSAFLAQNPGVVAVGGRVLRIDEDGWPVCEGSIVETHEEIDGRHLLAQGGAIPHPTAMLRTDALRKIGGYRSECEPAEDIDMFLRLAEVGRLANIPGVVLKYRFNSQGVSQNRVKIQREKTIRIVQETRLRRGLPPIEMDMRDMHLVSGEFTRRTILSSIAHRNGRTAWKHFLRTLTRSPQWLLQPKWIVWCALATYKSMFSPQRARAISNWKINK